MAPEPAGRSGLPTLKRPRRVVFTGAYPTTATGKIRRVELREKATALLAESQPAAEARIYSERDLARQSQDHHLGWRPPSDQNAVFIHNVPVTLCRFTDSARAKGTGMAKSATEPMKCQAGVPSVGLAAPSPTQ